MMERLLLKDRDGNLIYPAPVFVEVNGKEIEISQVPLYIYTPNIINRHNRSFRKMKSPVEGVMSIMISPNEETFAVRSSNEVAVIDLLE